MRHHFEEVLVVQHRFYNVLDVIRHVRVFGDDGLKRLYPAMDIVGAGSEGSILHIVGRQETQQLADAHQCLLLRIAHEVGNAALAAMRIGTAQFLLVHLLVGHGLYHVRTGDKHVALLLYHEDKVGKRRRVACPTGTRTQNSGYLRNDTRRNGVLIEDGGIACQAVHTFLDACAARIVEGNDGSTVLQGKLLHLYNLCGIRLAERTAMRREVVGIDKYKAAVYLSVTGHHAVSGNLFLLHAEVGATVVHELVQLIERAFVQQHVNTFAGSHAAGGVLFLYLVYAPTQRGTFVQFLKLAVYFFSVHICIYNLVIYNIRTECDSGLFPLYQLQFNQYLVGIYRFALAHEDVADDAVGIYLIVTLHLHGFQHHGNVAGSQSVAHLDGDAYHLARHRSQNLVALLLVGSFLHVQILGLRVYNVYVEGTLEHADVIALSSLAAHKACVERVSVVQDGATSVLRHHNVHFVRLSVNGKLNLISFLTHQGNVCYTVSYMYFHY